MSYKEASTQKENSAGEANVAVPFDEPEPMTERGKKKKTHPFASVHTVAAKNSVRGKARADSFFCTNYNGIIVEGQVDMGENNGWSGFVLENNPNTKSPRRSNTTFSTQTRFYDPADGPISPGPKYDTAPGLSTQKSTTFGATQHSKRSGRDSFVFGSMGKNGLLSPTSTGPSSKDVGPGAYKNEIPALNLKFHDSSSRWGQSRTTRFKHAYTDSPGAGQYPVAQCTTTRDPLWSPKGVNMGPYKVKPKRAQSAAIRRSSSAMLPTYHETLHSLSSTQRRNSTSRGPTFTEYELDGKKVKIEVKKPSTFCPRVPTSMYSGLKVDRKAGPKGTHSPGPCYYPDCGNWKLKNKPRKRGFVASAWR